MARKSKEQRLKELRLEIRRVKDRERSFKKMTPEKRRMAIARDVIEQVRRKRIVPESGTWCEVNDGDGLLKNSLPIEVTEETQLQTVLAGLPCSACAVGSLFACAVLRKDDLPLSDVGSGVTSVDIEGMNEYNDAIEVNPGDFSACAAYMDDIFDEDQLLLMEAAFEQGGTQGWEQHNLGGYTDACEFGGGFEDDEDRLLAIMENVLANKGTFVPPPASDEDPDLIDVGE